MDICGKTREYLEDEDDEIQWKKMMKTGKQQAGTSLYLRYFLSQSSAAAVHCVQCSFC